jgi:hypothetical protein
MASDTEIISSVLNKIINDAGYPYDNIFTKVPLIQYLLLRDQRDAKGNALSANSRVRKIDGGAAIEMPLEYATGNSSVFYTGYDVLTFTPKETITNAEWPWAFMANTLVLDKKDVLKASGEARKIANLTGAKLRNMNKTVATGLNSALLATSPATGDYESIPKLVPADPTAAATIGGIAQATNSWWQNKTSTAASASTWQLLVQDIENLRNTIAYNMAGDKPDLMLTDQYVYEYLINYLRSKGSHTFRDTDMSNVLDMDVLKFAGMSVIWDTSVPTLSATTSTAFLLNTDYIQFVMHSQRQFQVDGPIDMMVASQQDAWGWVLLMMGNLTCSNRSKQGVVYAISQALTA